MELKTIIKKVKINFKLACLIIFQFFKIMLLISLTKMLIISLFK